MEWSKNPQREPLARSYEDSGERNAYSREAGETSSNVSQEQRRRRRIGESSHESSGFAPQQRRRRRINEVRGDNNPSHNPSNRYSSTNEYWDSSADYQREKRERNEQRTFYKEQYNQMRESKRLNDTDGIPRRKFSYGDNTSYGARSNYGDRPERPQQRYNHSYSNKKGGRQEGAKGYKKMVEKRPPAYTQPEIDLTEEVRLNKFLSNAGVCSRREADELIKAGAVLVDGVPVTELGTKITPQARVEVNGREIRPENKVYVLLNKPRNCVTTTDDPQERMTVMNIVRNACKERIYPVGRLDRNTTGVLLLTNDGDLAAKLVHPTFKKKKIYHVWLDKEVSSEDMQKIADGIDLEDGEMHADAISYVTDEDLSQVGIEIHSGRNRIVRRIFEHLGYHVKKLDRVYFAGLTKKNLGRGKWRYLTQEEVNALQMGAFE